MKKWWLIVGGLITLIIAGVVIYVVSIDWNEHKSKIADEVSMLTGKRVVFDGPVSLSIFPAPYLTAQDIKVYSQDNKIEEPLVTLKSLVASLELIPFIKGDFKVNRMSLVEPAVRMEVFQDGSWNWKSDLSAEQRQKLEDVQVTLDSVTIENAKLNYIDKIRDINWNFTDMNAEVIASSVFGPYRIEGNYIKDGNPEGFAISLGRVSEDYATSLNFAFNNPATSTYFRFDGSVLFKNAAANGNFVFESKKLMNFVNLNFKDFKLDKEYDKPLAMSMAVNLNKEKTELTDLVIKYGNTAAAGNVIIPRVLENVNLTEDSQPERQRIELAFNLTDFELDPVANFIKEKIKLYNDNPQEKFRVKLAWDVVADIRAIKATYRGQNIKNMVMSFDVLPDKINLTNAEMVLPGESATKITGSAFPNKNGMLTYSFDTALNTDNFTSLLNWVGIDPVMPVKSIYKKVNYSAKINGNIRQVKIAPFNLGIDNSTLRGNLGIMFGTRPRVMAMIEGDNINFDNYVNRLPSELSEEGLDKRLLYRMEKLSFIRDYDVNFMTKLGLGIYGSTPFENMQFNGQLLNGNLNIQVLNIGSLATAKVNVKGTVNNFGTSNLEFSGLNYAVSTKEAGAFFNKFNIALPGFNAEIMKSFMDTGIISGSLQQFRIGNKMKIEDFELETQGEINRNNPNELYSGSVKAKSPDFVKMLNNFGINYSPNVYSLGIFTLDTKFKGNLNKFVATDLQVGVGQNQLKGNLDYDKMNARSLVKGNFNINQLEFERFFYANAVKPATDKTNFMLGGSGKAEFLTKPSWSNDKIDYTFYNSFDADMSLYIDKLIYNNKQFGNAKSKVVLNLGNLKVSDVAAKYKESEIVGSLEASIAANPTLKADFDISNFSVEDADLVGKKYGIEDGKARVHFVVDTSAVSTEEMVSKLNGEASFEVADANFKGWNFGDVVNDLKRRKISEGLAALIKNSMESGLTKLKKINGVIFFRNGNYEIKNTKITGEDFGIDLKATGSLTGWDVNAVFDTEIKTPVPVPGFIFSWKGDLSNPVLDVNVTSLTNMYDAEKNRIAAERVAQEQAAMADLRAKMDKEQATLNIFDGNLYKITRDYKRLSENAQNKESLEAYKAMGADLEKLKKQSAEVATLALTPKFDESLITQAKNKTAIMIEDLERIKTELNSSFQKDIKFRINNNYNQIVKSYSIAQDKMKEFRSHIADYKSRLKGIKTDYDLQKDEAVNELIKEVELRVVDITEVNEKMGLDYPKTQNSKNANELIKFEKSSVEMSGKVNDYMTEIEEKAGKLYIHADEKIKAEEDAYNQAKRQAEVKRKLAENTGKISVKGATKSRTVVRDIEDIEKSEKLQEKDELKVLDFSQKKPQNVVVRKDQKSAKKSSKKQKSFIKKSSGVVSKASGVIVKK